MVAVGLTHYCLILLNFVTDGQTSGYLAIANWGGLIKGVDLLVDQRQTMHAWVLQLAAHQLDNDPEWEETCSNMAHNRMKPGSSLAYGAS